MNLLPETFHPLIREWFNSTYKKPTPVQIAAWPLVSEGKNVLAMAPTGSGKTLTAFLDAISSFVSGKFDPEKLQVLYISPLKALNEDIRENLLSPISSMRLFFRERKEVFPEINVMTRSGDTSQSERRRMFSKPPSILATTPESFSLILNSPVSRKVLENVKLVILDEIHALLESKRGSILSVSLERLTLLAGDFSRVALSATVEPASLAAAFAGGLKISDDMDSVPQKEKKLVPRPVSIMAPCSEKRIELSVRYPDIDLAERTASSESENFFSSNTFSRYDAIAIDICKRIKEKNTILVFVDTRRIAENMARLINRESGEGTAWAHHGSLSKELRRSVEQRLKNGRLKCVVATASLELGIDIGSISEVDLAGTPSSVARTLQRIGRSGHAVDQPSRAILYPLHNMDLLKAAALCNVLPVITGIRENKESSGLDAIVPPENPLDILSQLIIAMCACDPWDPTELYTFFKRSFTFHDLPYELFDKTIDSLLEKGTVVERGKSGPRIVLNLATGKLEAPQGMLALVYSSGGAISDRGAYTLRISGHGTKIGELDEEFVWERHIGDSFSFGTQSWKITSIDENAVEVIPLGHATEFIPFWKADPGSIGGTIAEGMLEILEQFNQSGEKEKFKKLITKNGRFEDNATNSLEYFLARQSALQKDTERNPVILSGKNSIAIEITTNSNKSGDSVFLVMHSFRGRKIHQPIALALESVLSEMLDMKIHVTCDDISVLVEFPSSVAISIESVMPSVFLKLSNEDSLDVFVRTALPASGLFGAVFRENAERALLLPRGGFGKRRPLWITRLRAKRLFSRLSARLDHPVIIETYRTCLCDVFDMKGAHDFVKNISGNIIKLKYFRTMMPSPFCSGLIWREINTRMYESDELDAVSGSSATDRAISLASKNSSARIIVRKDVFESSLARIRREDPDWAPENITELIAWVRERLAVPLTSFNKLLQSISGKTGSSETEWPDILKTKRFPGACEDVVVHKDMDEKPGMTDIKNTEEFLIRWLPYEGATEIKSLSGLFGWEISDIEKVCSRLEESGMIIRGKFAEGVSENSLCDSQVYAYMLRRGKSTVGKNFHPLPASDFPGFLAVLHGLKKSGSPERSLIKSGDRIFILSEHMKKLEGIPIPAELWETEILPARIPEYSPLMLDELLARREWIWFSPGKYSIAFCRADNYVSFSPELAKPGSGSKKRKTCILADTDEDIDFRELRDRLDISISESEKYLWDSIWDGLVSSDSFETLRIGALDGFAKKESRTEAAKTVSTYKSRPLPRSIARQRLSSSMRSGTSFRSEMPGRWYSLEIDIDEFDEVDEAEMAVDRALSVLECHGIASSLTLSRETGLRSWSSLYPVFRRMELSGEIISGYFFENIGGPQFIKPETFELLSNLDELVPDCFVINATDPASICGSGLPDPQGVFPSRIPSSRLVFARGDLAAVIRLSGKDVRFLVSPSDPYMEKIAACILEPPRRSVNPPARVIIESINGERASDSQYCTVLESAGFERDRGNLVFWR